jgi:transposase-like protein
MASNLSAPHFHDEQAAYDYVEARVWPNGRVCPHCGVVERSGALKGKSNRIGLYKCYACRKPFTVKVGTIFEDSHIKMTVWLQAMYLMAASKKGISANQLHRTLGITLKSAWFLAHRIREAMTGGNPGPLGGPGVTVEVDETFHGPADYIYVNDKGWQKKRGAYAKPHKIVTLVERGGRARSVKVQDLDIPTIEAVLSQVDPTSTLNTDQAQHYKAPGRRFADHQSVNHGKGEYGRGPTTTNTVEGFFSIFKRGMVGIYQHCDEKHLSRYLAEFDFRYSNRSALGVDDAGRADRALDGVVGKRLQYRSACA